ncbi:hypothetical protein KR215_000626, partial [Drosophila sulfurigaster]
MRNGGNRTLFKSADMSSAICFHAAGPRAYNHLYRKGFPLPSRATLYRWLTEVQINAGPLDVVIDLMENEEMSEVDKLCVLSFDEMKVAEAIEYDSKADVVYEPSNYVHLAIVRGLIKSWKQPVFFDFNTRMDVQTLHSIVTKLYKRGYPVVAIVCDCGPGNQRLWAELGISETKTWFSHPSDGNLKIFVFSDTPHLIKLVRNHYVGSGLVVNGKKLTKTTVQQAISHCSKSDVSILFGSLAKQKVNFAIQLFSNTTASAIRRCYAFGKDVDNACETADLFKLLNDCFDVFNSKLSTENSIETTKPYGQDIDIQRGILAKMTELMGTSIIGQTHKLAFLRRLVWIFVQKKYDILYILTSRLNQDIVENFFGTMRSK